MPLSHPCIEPGCTAEGIIGEGVRLRDGELGFWRCWRHDRAGRATVSPGRPVAPGGQGALDL